MTHVYLFIIIMPVTHDCKFFSVSATGLNVKNYLSLMPNPEMHKAGNNIKFQTEINTVVTQLQRQKMK